MGDVVTQKPPRLNTLEGNPSEMRYARHGHEFNGVNPVQLGREIRSRKSPRLNPLRGAPLGAIQPR